MKLTRDRWLRAAKCIALCIYAMALLSMAHAQAVSTTTVQGTVYLANGQPGAGTLQLSWPAFTTAANQAIAAGRTTAAIGADGFVSVNLAPNLGSSPAGLYYTAVYYMSSGATSTEYWVVPAAAQASIAQVRAQVMPAAQALQTVNKAYVDQAIQSAAQSALSPTGGTLTGPLYLSADPTQTMQAADKHYVDTAFSQAVPLTGASLTGPLTSVQLGAAYQVDQFPGADFGAKLQACLSAINSTYGGTCDARNFTGSQSMGANLNFSTANTAVLLPCATISTASQLIVTAGTRNVSLRGCALRGASNAGGNQGGTVFLYSGAAALLQVGDPTYASDTMGFHLDNAVMNTTTSASSTAQALAIYRTQELDLQSLYLLGNSNQTGITLDGTGNYTGGTFYDNQISGFQTAINAIGHQVSNPATTDWLNASTFVRLHINCPTSGGNPISGTYGINLLQGDGNTFTGGDVEGCSTALHLGPNAQNNTILGLRNENSTSQIVADSGSSYNNWITGGTMFTGKLTDNGTRNSFLDTFHRSFNGMTGDWYGSQQDATVTNHFRLGTGSGNERGLLNRYQTDYGYRWTTGLSDAAAGEQFYQVLDELNNVYRLSIGQYNNGQSSTNNQTVVNAAGSGAIVLNGSNNAGTGGVVFGSGGPTETTVATVDSSGNAHFNGTLQISGVSTFTGSTTVKNNADAEIDSILSAGATANQKESFIYKDYTGASQWYLVKDTSNNWAVNSAIGGLDSFKAYQSTGSGDTYINSANSSGHIRLNYETGSGAETDIYSGSSAALVAAFLGTTAIKFPGLAAASGHNCMQIDNSGYITNTGAACGSGGGSGTVNSGASGQIAYYSASGTALSGMSTIPVSSGGTGAATPSAAIAALGGASTAATTTQTFAGPLNVPSLNSSVNGLINVASPGFGLASNTCSGDDTAAFTAAQAAAEAFAVANVRAATIVVPPGCYNVSSSFKWQLVSIWGLSGPASSNAYGTGGVIIKQTTPGADVLATQDPSLGTSTYTQSSWSLKHLTLVVNDSAQGTHPHRWPGRWCDDVATTSGSAVIKTTSCQITPGDAGQALMLTGAGASGANLVTTIQSVTPGWASPGSSWQVITLAAAPSATLTNVHTYIATGNQSATTNIGPCGIAFDNYDAKASDWPTGYKNNASSYSSIEDVSITGASAASSGQNNSCGIFAQGAAINYALHASQFNINRLVYGVVQTTSELNPASASSNGDYQTWKDGQFNNTFEPWLSVNGEVATLDTIETNGTPIGFQILGAGNTTGDANSNWRVSNVSGGGSPFTTLGWHVTGGNGQYTDVEFGNNAFLDTSGATYLQPQMYNATVDGSLNSADGRGQITGTVANGGMGNSGFNVLGTNSFSLPASKRFAAIPFKGANDLAGRVTADFIADGNPTAPHYNHDDLMLWPIDFMVNSYGSPIWNTYFTADSTALTGGTWNFVTGGATVSQWQQFAGPGGNSGQLVVGTNLPQQTIDVAVSGKCDSGTTTFTFNVGAYTGTTLALTGTCSTAFATYTGKLNLVSGDAGKYILLSGGAATNFRVQWVDLQPQTNADTASALSAPSTLPTNTLAHTNSPCDSTNAVATDAYVSACGGTTTATAWVSGVAGGSVAGLGTANTTRLYSFTLNTAINVSKISYRIATADNTTDSYDMGIYSYSGTLLCDLGATAGTTFAPSASAFTLPFSAVAGGNCALSAGNYLFGWTGTATTAILKGVNNSWMAQSNANPAAGSTTTGGALNSTITPAADNWADSNQFPEIALHN